MSSDTLQKAKIALDGGAALTEFGIDAVASNRTYSAAIAAGGGVPMLITDPAEAEAFAALCDGLVLSGSFSYNPFPERKAEVDQHESVRRVEETVPIIDAFVKQRKPILGICLGIQSLNLYFGGTLKDMFKLTDGVEHMLDFHSVRCSEKSFMRPLFGEEFLVNSRHNRKIDRLAEDLIATAWSPDGIIEEVVHRSLPVYAVEYHPERMRGDDREPPFGPDTTPLFQWFCDLCRDRSKLTVEKGYTS